MLAIPGVLILCLLCYVAHSIRLKSFDGIEIDLGEAVGLTPSSSISGDTLQKVILGVENGNKENLYFFGLLKLYGISVPKNSTIAAMSFKKAGDLGHKEGATAYGVCLMSGTGVKQDYNSAIHWFRKGVELNDENAYWLLGRMYLEGKGVSHPLFQEAFELMKVAANAGHSQAEHFLGMMYEYGLGTSQDFDKAAENYRRAAEKNFPESMYNLALMYAFGRGVDQSYARALPLLDAACTLDHAPSVYYMGIFKMFGYGMKVNYEQAFNWFERAASIGDMRITEKANQAAREVRNLLDRAHDENEKVIESFRQRSEEY